MAQWLLVCCWFLETHNVVIVQPDSLAGTILIEGAMKLLKSFGVKEHTLAQIPCWDDEEKWL